MIWHGWNIWAYLDPGSHGVIKECGLQRPKNAENFKFFAIVEHRVGIVSPPPLLMALDLKSQENVDPTGSLPLGLEK